MKLRAEWCSLAEVPTPCASCGEDIGVGKVIARRNDWPVHTRCWRDTFRTWPICRARRMSRSGHCRAQVPPGAGRCLAHQDDSQPRSRSARRKAQRKRQLERLEAGS